ncbi:ATP-binding cassette domain-containing protein [Nocardia sp. NPDC049190]|uniref:ABC transporter ATP-binding protein/permease n=1 Tax=Nocardia sp. NPDC049190 TaxID=3155650 RepID=UPI00340B4B34
MARPPIDPRLWRYARSARSYLAVSVALSLVITGSIVVGAVMLGRVLSGVVTDRDRRTLGAWTAELTVLALAIAGRALATWVQSRLAHRAGASVVAELENAVLATGARLPPRELDTRRTELAVVVGTGLSGLRGYLVGYLPALLLAVLVPPIVLTVIVLHDLTSGVIVLLTLPLIPVFMILIGLLTQGRAEATLAATTRLSDQLLDLFAGMPTLRALGREMGRAHDVSVREHDAATGGGPAASSHGSAAGPEAGTMQHRVRDLGDALRRRTMRALRLAFLSSMVLEMLATLSVALVAVSIGLRLVFGEMSLYAGLVCLVLAPEVYLPLRMVGERFHAAQDGMAAADKAFAVIGSALVAAGRSAGFGSGESADGAVGSKVFVAPGSALDAAGSPGGPGSDASVGDGAGSIELRAVSVLARNGFAPSELSAVLRPGVVTVLAGPNGSGKSTAVQAILGLVAPEHGSVTVDGIDVRELDCDRWWARVAWLPQRPVLVPGTLRDNLELLGAPARGVLDDLEATCVATGFDAVLADLPDRWDTVVGPGGVGLSLGQRQRLALTRVLATDRPILLLDEPTAHLDAANAATVLAALRERARAGALVVVIGHHPAVLAAADHVVRVRADHAVVAK